MTFKKEIVKLQIRNKFIFGNTLKPHKKTPDDIMISH